MPHTSLQSNPHASLLWLFAPQNTKNGKVPWRCRFHELRQFVPSVPQISMRSNFAKTTYVCASKPMLFPPSIVCLAHACLHQWPTLCLSATMSYCSLRCGSPELQNEAERPLETSFAQKLSVLRRVNSSTASTTGPLSALRCCKYWDIFFRPCSPPETPGASSPTSTNNNESPQISDDV